MQVIAAFAAAIVALVAIDLLWWFGVASRRPGHRGSRRVQKAGRRKSGFGLLGYGLLAIGLFLLGIHPTAPVEAASSSTPQRAPMVSAASAPT